jgi:homoserine kinase
MQKPDNAITVAVPASTSNLGPGFDSLGLALDLANEVTVAPAAEFPGDPFLLEAADLFFGAAGLAPLPFSCAVSGDVPRSRGLGSSVTVRLGLLQGLNFLHGEKLAPEEIYHLCVKLEGHPDNAAASAFGGFTISFPDGSWQRHRVADKLRIVLLIPELELATTEARRAVPLNFSRADAVSNVACAAGVAAALASGHYEDLRGCFTDRFHQPYRGKFLTFLDPTIEAGVAAGALGGWLSGSGSTVACALLESACDPRQVAERMLEASGVTAQTRVVGADNQGMRILPAAD